MEYTFDLSDSITSQDRHGNIPMAEILKRKLKNEIETKQLPNKFKFVTDEPKFRRAFTPIFGRWPKVYILDDYRTVDPQSMTWNQFNEQRTRVNDYDFKLYKFALLDEEMAVDKDGFIQPGQLENTDITTGTVGLPPKVIN